MSWNLKTLQWIAVLVAVQLGAAQNRIQAASGTQFGSEAQGDILSQPGDARKLVQDNGLWENAIVPYKFGDSLINRLLVEEAIDVWRENTCIEFQEVNDSYVGQPHIRFEHSETVCSSRVGKSPFGQYIYFQPECLTDLGQAVHYIGRALGFYNEHSRSDRDAHVRVLLQNVKKGKENDFLLATTNDDDPYDYASIMHYGPRHFSNYDAPTLLPKDLLMLPLMGSKKLSFYDLKQINTAYKCAENNCADVNITCERGGYVGPNCSCICPDGIYGTNCEMYDVSYSESLFQQISPDTETIKTTEATAQITTPEYPSVIQNGITFVKKLVAPRGNKVKIVIEDFDMLPRYSDGVCEEDFLAIYSSENDDQPSTFCFSEISSGREFYSYGNVMVLEYKSHDYASRGQVSSYKGFNITISHVEDILELYNETTSGRCTLDEENALNTYLFKSPNYPNKYNCFQHCNFKLKTNVPSYLRVKALTTNICFWDSVWLDYTIGSNSYRFSRKGQEYIIPTSLVAIRLSPFLFGSGKFNLEIEVLTSDCHKVLELNEDDGGVVELPAAYEANTICEWWLVAPESKIIQLDTRESFNIQTLRDTFTPQDCKEDYLLVNWNADEYYTDSRNKRAYCGYNTKQIFMSVKNKMNLLFHGKTGGENKFRAYYRVL